MKGISPIIATILLIVMTVAIAGLMYAWMSGMFSSLTTQTNQQIQQSTQVVAFRVASIYSCNSKSNVCAVIFNSGNVPLTISNNAWAIIATEYYKTNASPTGNTYNCNITSQTSNTIQQNTQSTLTL
ncbi:MAG: archaellin/type IV pilin N-terminal domain-containing protein, partial [Nanopusillaceae archaeon]